MGLGLEGSLEINYSQSLPLGQHEWKHVPEAHTTISEFLAWRYMEDLAEMIL